MFEMLLKTWMDSVVCNSDVEVLISYLHFMISLLVLPKELQHFFYLAVEVLQNLICFFIPSVFTLLPRCSIVFDY